MNLTGRSLAGDSVNFERVEHDYYATDPESTKSLLEVEDFSEGNFLEPCCGEGHISEIIKQYYPNAYVRSTDIVNRGYGHGKVDFLNPYAFKDVNFDYIITNPPYKLAKEFIDRSLTIANKKVAMFLKIQFLEGQSRKEWFGTTPLKSVYVFSKRQNPWRNGQQLNPHTNKKWSSTMCFAWFIWEKGFNGEPTIKWL